MPTVELGESYSPLLDMIVSEVSNKFYDYYMSDNQNLIAYPNTPTRPKWEAKAIQEVGELARNPSDPRRTRSQFKSAFSIKEPCFA